MAKPWTRDPSEFKHPNLFRWVEINRGKIIWASLTLIQNWIAKDRPGPQEGTSAFGTFEDWRLVLGGILRAAGISGFLGNLEEFYNASNDESQALNVFVDAWWEKFQGKEVGVNDLYPLVIDKSIPIELGRNTSERGEKTALGKLLSRSRGRQIGEYRISLGTTRQRALQYKLVRVSEQEPNEK